MSEKTASVLLTARRRVLKALRRRLGRALPCLIFVIAQPCAGQDAGTTDQRESNYEKQLKSENRLKSESQLKLLETIVRFVRWPENAFRTKTSLGLCVFESANGSAYPLINDMYSGKTFHHKTVVPRRVVSTEALYGCDILYFTELEPATVTKAAQLVATHPVLTVGTTRGYAQLGVHVNMLENRNKPVFEVNVEALDKAGLSASYKLLSRATLVGPVGTHAK